MAETSLTIIKKTKEVTLAQLTSLASANALDVDLSYIITDFVQGRLVAGTKLMVKAIAPNEVGMHCSVLSTYDIDSWFGLYDQSQQKLIECQDHQENIVRDSTGTAIANFDWGNLLITKCQVIDSTWVQTIGAARPMTNVKLFDGASLTTSGMVGGGLSGVSLTGATLTLTNANVTLNNVTMLPTSIWTGVGYLGANVISDYFLSSGGKIEMDGSTGQLQATRVQVQTDGWISHTPNVPSGQHITGSNLVIHTKGKIDHQFGSMALTNVEISGEASIYHLGSSSSITLTNTKLANLAYIEKGTTSSGIISLNRTVVQNYAQIINSSAGTITLTNTTVEGTAVNGTSTASAVRMLASSGGAITMNGGGIRSGGYIQKAGTSTSGTITLSGVEVISSAYVQATSTGGITLRWGEVKNGGYIENAGAGLLSGDNFFASMGYVRKTDTASAVSDTFVNTRILGGALEFYTLNATSGNTVNHSTIDGNTLSKITFAGTSSSNSLSRWLVANGALTITNTNSQNSMYQNEIFSGGVVNVTDCGSNVQDMRFCTVMSGGNFTIQNKTNVAAYYRNTIHSLGKITAEETSGGVSNSDVAQGELVAQSGGSFDRFHKRGSGVVSSGAFAHQHCVHHTSTNITLTVANSAMGTYYTTAMA